MDEPKLDPKTQRYIERMEKHLELVEKTGTYNIQRIDIIIIALSTSGFLFSATAFADALDGCDGYNARLILAIAAATYALAIVTNVLSLWTGHRSNKNEEQWTKLEIEKEKMQLDETDAQKAYDKKVKRFNVLTAILNTISTAALILGIVLNVTVLFLAV